MKEHSGEELTDWEQTCIEQPPKERNKTKKHGGKRADEALMEWDETVIDRGIQHRKAFSDMNKLYWDKIHSESDIEITHLRVVREKRGFALIG